MKKILLVEDHPIMSAGTCRMLRNRIPDAEIMETDTFWKAMNESAHNDFDLVIMDVGIPGGDSVRMVEKFRKQWPTLPLLMFSSYDESVYALPFVRAGANGFISKKAKEDEFWLAVQTVLFRKKIFIGDNVRDLTLDNYIKPNTRSADMFELLSQREREIFQLFYKRKGVSEIGGILGLSTSTINTYRVRIFKKMGVNNMIDLIQKYEILSSPT